MQSWLECGWFSCAKRFEPGRRANRFGRADGRRHEGALYCSPACRQAVYRFRRDGGSRTVTNDSRTVTLDVRTVTAAPAVSRTVTRPPAPPPPTDVGIKNAMDNPSPTPATGVPFLSAADAIRAAALIASIPDGNSRQAKARHGNGPGRCSCPTSGKDRARAGRA
jgi:hypothetical protein